MSGYVSLLDDVVGLTAVDVLLILSIWIGAVITISIALRLQRIGRIEWEISTPRHIGLYDVFIFG